MKKLISYITVLALSGGFYACAQQDPQLGKVPVDNVVKAMTIEEKARLLVGTGMAGFGGGSSNAVVGETQSLVPGAAGTTYPIPRLGIPAIVVADGPAGLRIAPTREGNADTYYCTAFPVGTLLASTWDVGLVEKVGKAMGNEVLEYGVDVLLAPALNIHRNPLCGRNFEYYSEDPLISGMITAAMVKGVQSNGVGTSIKHFAVNNQETNRMANDARLSTRALREIYLKGFEIAVKESDPWTVMSSYNYINGTYASENRGLLTTVLRDEWGFKGFVMTDWFGGKNPPVQVYAGNDLLMPGHDGQYQAIVDAVKNGTLKVEDVDVNVKRILEIILMSPRFKGYKYTNKPDLKAHAVVTRQSASEGMILLKNEGNTLPLPQTVKKIAAFGTTSYDFIAGGTGSGDVNEAYTVSLVEGMLNSGYTLDSEIEKIYKDYDATEKAKQPKSDNPMSAFMNKPRIPEFIPEKSLLERKAKDSDIACITIGRNSGEFSDRTLDGDFLLTAEEKELIRQVSDAFHKEKKKVIVILNIGGVVETASWKNIPDAILLAWQGGQEGGNSVADILKGTINPSGKLTMTFPVNYMDHASSSNFPYDYKPTGNPMGGMTAAEKEEKDKIKNVDYTIYEEDIYVGYRYFDTFEKDVSYPFGFGLSYTAFEYANAQVKKTNNGYNVTVDVKNTGKVSGKEVVQLYVTAPTNATFGKPQKELKAFAKTKELKSGESETVTLFITDYNLASFDQNKSAWVTDSGKYKMFIGASSKDIRMTLDLDIDQVKSFEVNNVMQK